MHYGDRGVTVVWIVTGIVIGWLVAGKLTGHTSPWGQLWHWMRGHKVKASVIVVSLILVVGQLVFGWFVHKAGNESPCEEMGSYGRTS